MAGQKREARLRARCPGRPRLTCNMKEDVDARVKPGHDEWKPTAAPGEKMAIADKLVLQRQHHLKWRSFDRLELVLMIVCGVLCFGFSLSVMCDIVTRTIGHPWLWLQEVTSTLFIYAIFIGAAVATRRNDHLYLTAISDACTARRG